MSTGILDRLMQSYDEQSVGFNSLRPHNVRDILLVASLYDSYSLAEDGRLAERILGDFHNLSLSAPAYLTRVSTAGRRGISACDTPTTRPVSIAGADSGSSRTRSSGSSRRSP